MSKVSTTLAVGDTCEVSRNGPIPAGTYTVAPNTCDRWCHPKWYCVTHREHLGSAFLRDLHVAKGAHVFVKLCSIHKVVSA